MYRAVTIVPGTLECRMWLGEWWPWKGEMQASNTSTPEHPQCMLTFNAKCSGGGEGRGAVQCNDGPETVRCQWNGTPSTGLIC